MKTIFIISLAIIISLAQSLIVQAQSFTFLNGNTITHTYDTSIMETFHVEFKYNKQEEVTIEWRIIENTLPKGWSYSICDHGNCYVGAPEGVKSMKTITVDELSDGFNPFFILTCSPAEIHGKGTMKMYVYDPSEPNSGDTVSFNLDYPLTSLDKNQLAASIQVYPNPTSDFLKFVNPLNDNLSVSIRSILGTTVSKLELSSNSKEVVYLNHLSNGTYLCQLINNRTNEAFTKKFIIQR